MLVNKFKKIFEQDINDYRAIPFWSWNSNLDDAELIRQIEEMKEVGMGGFIIHARTGLDIEYLGERWFECVKVCLDKAKELGMNAWIYDENGWPSGFVGGKLLKNTDFCARYLEYSVTECFDECAFAVFKKENDQFIRINKSEKGIKEYHNIYLRISPANTDILNPVVVDEFIKETHEEYYKRFKDSFGKELTGFFTDEPQYYRWGTPYTPVAEKYFLDNYGQDIRDGLIYLFIDCEQGYQFREKYYKALNYLYTHNFYERIYNWCNQHNCKLTGHSVEEPSLFTQMWGGAGCMPSYEYENIPAIDWLGRECGQNELSPKQIGSVASQLGKKQVLTETYGCSGYDVTPYELKSIGEYQYFNGVNLMCHHLYPYSISKQGRYDHPPVFSRHSNWKEGFKSFNEHFTRLGYIVSNTSEECDLLIIHPMYGVYLNYIKDKEYDSVKQLEDSFRELLLQLRKNGVQYHFADESILKRYGKVEGNKLIVGKCSYDKVLVPDMKTLSISTYNILKEYKGKILLMGDISYIDGVRTQVDLKSNITFEDIADNTSIKFRCDDGLSFMTARKSELGQFIFIKNTSRTKSSSVKLSGVAEEYCQIDIDELKTKNITDELVIPASGSVILIKAENAHSEKIIYDNKNITGNFKTESISENYLVMDYASMSYDGKNYSDIMPLNQIFDNLLRTDYKGKLFIKHIFNVDNIMPLTLIMEKANIISAKINGKEIIFNQSDYDICYVESDISDKIKIGQNEFNYELHYYQHDGVHFALFDPLATESLRNCLYYDTHIENVYIKGNFVLDKDFVISKKKTLPPVTNELYKYGYPFFKGEYIVSGNYNYDGNSKIYLSVDGRYVMIIAEINGKITDITLDKSKEITNYLKKGSNKIKLKVRSSLRNIYGPHHCKGTPEPLAVCPFIFTLRGAWGNGKPDDYTDNYNFVPFGIEQVNIVTEK